MKATAFTWRGISTTLHVRPVSVVCASSPTSSRRGAEAIQHSVGEMAETPCKLNQVGIGACFFHAAVADDVIDNDKMPNHRQRAPVFFMLPGVRKRYRPQMGGTELKGCGVVTFSLKPADRPGRQ